MTNKTTLEQAIQNMGAHLYNLRTVDNVMVEYSNQLDIITVDFPGTDPTYIHNQQFLYQLQLHNEQYK